MTGDSILADLQPFEWDPVASVAYEVAIEAVGLAVAAITPLLAAARQQGDDAAVTELVDLRRRCVAARDELAPTDHEAVAATTHHHRALADHLHRRAD